MHRGKERLREGLGRQTRLEMLTVKNWVEAIAKTLRAGTGKPREH